MMRKTQILAGLLAALLLFSSCGRTADETETTTSAMTTTEATTVTTTTSAATTTAETEPPAPQLDPNTVYVVNEGVTQYSVVLAAGALTKPGGSGVKKNAETRKMDKLPKELPTPIVNETMDLIAALTEKTGVTIPLTDDKTVSAADAGEFEILIGLTNREESIALHKTLKERTFAVQTTDTKLIIVGYDDNMTAEAIRYCVEHYVRGWESVGQVIENGLFTVPAHFSVTSPVSEQTPANTIHIGGAYTLKDATVFAEIAKDGSYKVMQGAATDGSYLYYCIENQALEAHESYIYAGEEGAGPHGVIVQPGEEFPCIYMHCSHIDATGDYVREPVDMVKNHCNITVCLYSGMEFPYRLEIKGNVNGYCLDGTLSEGEFCYKMELGDGGVCDVCVPRQSDDSLRLELSDDTGVIRVLALGEYISASGYDWMAKNLEDLTVSLDYSLTGMTIVVEGWDNEYHFDVVI